jgi:hypothetical protein
VNADQTVNADQNVNADQEAAKSEPSSSTRERKRLPDLCAFPLCLAAPTGETSVGVSIRAASVMSLLFGDGQTVVYSIASNEEPFLELPGILFRETKTCGVDKLYVREKRTTRTTLFKLLPEISFAGIRSS